jgi:hypothetical protein
LKKLPRSKVKNGKKGEEALQSRSKVKNGTKGEEALRSNRFSVEKKCSRWSVV